MRVFFRIALTLLLAVCTSASWGYSYDVSLDRFEKEVIESELQKFGYDDTLNLCYSGRECRHSYLQKKAQDGSFFAFDVGLVATKGVPQGISASSFSGMSQTIRQQIGHLSDDIAVHGSRASGTANAGSDVDIAIRVSSDRFQELIAKSFGSPNAGSAKMRTMMHAIDTGKIQAGEARMRGLRRSLSKQLGIPVDISIIRVGGKFDNGPFIPIK